MFVTVVVSLTVRWPSADALGKLEGVPPNFILATPNLERKKIAPEDPFLIDRLCHIYSLVFFLFRSLFGAPLRRLLVAFEPLLRGRLCSERLELAP